MKNRKAVWSYLRDAGGTMPGGKMHRDRILVVEDERELRELLDRYLTARGFEVTTAGNCAMAEELWRSAAPDLAILDYSLPDGNALQLIPRLKAVDPTIPVIILTGHGSIDLAVEAMKAGAEQFITKPAELSTLFVLIQRSLENQRNRRQQLAEKSHTRRRNPDPFLGESDAIQRLAELAHRVAPGDSPVLIQGETGTGKGVLARWLHDQGPRSSEPFVDLNCGGLPPDVLDDELFGHERGALAADEPGKPGLLEIAHRGTIFLDEVGDVDLQVQPKLLKVLEEKQFRRSRGVRDRYVNVRLLAATRQPMARMVQQKLFREDLYFRLSTVPIFIPPLRERIEDIPVLCSHILAGLSVDLSTGEFELSEGAVQALQGYSWPGNIRELRNVLERAVLITGNHALTENDLHFDAQIVSDLAGNGQFRTLDEVQRFYIEKVLRKENGRVEAAAKKLGIPRSSLYHKLKQYRTEHLQAGRVYADKGAPLP
jgi:DNA-binding NtrC family response regulator